MSIPKIDKKQIGERLRTALEVRGIKPADATRELRLPRQSSLNGQFNGSITIEDLTTFSHTFKVNIIWLLYGIGEFEMTYPLPEIFLKKNLFTI
jgi:hypothetical protein